MLDFNDILLAYAAYFIATLSPGPATLAIMATAMQQGRRSAIFMVVGVLITSMAWAVIAALGLTSLMKAWGLGFVVIKTVGACYLLWLAWRAARSALTTVDNVPLSSARRPRSGWGSFRRGLAIHATNPKAAIAWIAIISIGLDQQASISSTVVLIAGCSVIGCVTFGSYAVAFSTDFMVELYQRCRRTIEATMAILFGLAGLKLLSTRLAENA